MLEGVELTALGTLDLSARGGGSHLGGGGGVSGRSQSQQGRKGEDVELHDDGLWMDGCDQEGGAVTSGSHKAKDGGGGRKKSGMQR